MDDREERIAILTMLTHVSDLDGGLDEREKLLIRSIAIKLDIDEVTTEDIIAGRLSAEISPPEPESDRIPYFQMCVMASGVNGNFNEKETLYCKKLGMRLGLRDETLDKAIELFKQHYPNAVPADVLIRTFQINHN